MKSFSELEAALVKRADADVASAVADELNRVVENLAGRFKGRSEIKAVLDEAKPKLVLALTSPARDTVVSASIDKILGMYPDLVAKDAKDVKAG